ncbi:uncharacterized protein DS421_20g695190 [Arachis hypogaea]|nr:uncharacterized protein DS421_20g695190 [Arachis hypogaea]
MPNHLQFEEPSPSPFSPSTHITYDTHHLRLLTVAVDRRHPVTTHHMAAPLTKKGRTGRRREEERIGERRRGRRRLGLRRGTIVVACADCRLASPSRALTVAGQHHRRMCSLSLLSIVVVTQHRRRRSPEKTMFVQALQCTTLRLSSGVEKALFVKDVGRNDLAALIDSSQEVAKKSLEKAAECVRCLEEDMAKARKNMNFGFDATLRNWWHEVEKQFDVLTTSTDGWLHRSLFGKCIVSEIRTCSERRDIHGDSINKAQLKDFWDQISDQSFDSRLRTVFDMVDKDADGRITEEEIKEIICLSATTNKLSNIQQQAKEYAALIMEELDPKETGFIMESTISSGMDCSLVPFIVIYGLIMYDHAITSYFVGFLIVQGDAVALKSVAYSGKMKAEKRSLWSWTASLEKRSLFSNVKSVAFGAEKRSL